MCLKVPDRGYNVPSDMLKYCHNHSDLRSNVGWKLECMPPHQRQTCWSQVRSPRYICNMKDELGGFKNEEVS